MKRTIRVTVAPGIFSNERFASFEAEGRAYVLLVDESRLRGDALEVLVIDQSQDEAIVDLPGETLGSGSRVRLPANLLQG